MKEYAGSEVFGLIPAAGVGKRLYPFSKAVPKEMYPILGKAVIEHCVENLREGGIKRIFIVVGHQKGALMDYIGDGSYFGVKVVYLYQLERKGLGHAILQGKEWIAKTFVTLLGDSFIEPKHEIKDLLEFHQKNRPIATALLFEVDDPSEYGIVKLKKNGEIEKLVEKPSKELAEEYRLDGKYYAMCGAYAFEPEIFDYIERTKPGISGEIQITDSLDLALKNHEKVFGVVLKGKYLDIGKWSTVLRIEKDLLSDGDIETHIKEREEFVRMYENL